MRGAGRNGRTFAKGTIAAVGLALFTWWFVSGVGICPSNGDFARECRDEASRTGLGAAALVGGFVLLVTAIRLLGRSKDR